MTDDEGILRRWDDRLTNWALWEIGGSSTGIGSAYDGERGEGAPRQPIPLVGEALDTDALVRQLSREHYMAVRAWYVWTGSVQQKAHDLRVNRDTLADRVRAAKYRLEDMDQERRRHAQQVRAGLAMP